MNQRSGEPSILHVVTAVSWRGGEQQVAYLVRALNEKSIRQTVLCTSGSEMERFCRSENLDHITVPHKRGINMQFAKQVKKAVVSKDLNLVHTHDSHAHSYAVYAALLFGNHTGIVVHRRVDFPVKNNMLSKYKYNFRYIRRIICVSDKIREITGHSITDKSKLITIHSGIDITRFDGKKNTGILHREFGLEPGIKIIANIAAIAPHKDYFTFVDIVSELVKTTGGIKCFIIGDGPEKDRIVQYIAQKNMQEHVIMTGFRNDIPEILPELDIMLITSETEGLGTAILDAFACRVPVVATAAGGIPEIVINGKTGLLATVKDSVALAQAVNRLLNDSALAGMLTRNAYDHLQQFDYRNTALKTLDVYREALKV